DKFRPDRQLRGHPLAHLLAHKHGVGADINDPILREQSLNERLDMWIDQRLPAADGNHGRVALLCRSETVLYAHHVLERRGILSNPPTTRAGQVARMQRLELKHRGEFLRAT